MRKKFKKYRLVVAVYSMQRRVVGLMAYLSDFFKFRMLSKNTIVRFQLRWKDNYPCLLDRTSVTAFDAHYLYHPAWAARILARTKPSEHVDISSSLHFCTMVSAFIPVKFYDYRPAGVNLSNLTCEAADLLALPFESYALHSLSCMHVVEHIGLGRYGDALDPDGDLKAIAELKRVLAPGGSLLFVVPVGQPKIMFNAHRIYSYEQIVAYFAELELIEFSLVPDSSAVNSLIDNATRELADAQTYGCGCFWFKKNM